MLEGQKRGIQVPTANSFFLFLIYKETVLGDTVGLEWWIQVIWAGGDLREAFFGDGQQMTCWIPAPGPMVADMANEWIVAQNPTQLSVPNRSEAQNWQLF